MEPLVRELYDAIPEFGKINDPFFDNYDYTVYGNFGLFLEDIVQIHKYGKIRKQQYFNEFDLTERFSMTDMDGLISRSFQFIEKRFNTGNDHDKSVINLGFLKIVVTSDALLEYAPKYFSKDFFKDLLKRRRTILDGSIES